LYSIVDQSRAAETVYLNSSVRGRTTCTEPRIAASASKNVGDVGVWLEARPLGRVSRLEFADPLLWINTDSEAIG